MILILFFFFFFFFGINIILNLLKSLRNNGITRLPHEIGNLTALTHMYVFFFSSSYFF